MMPIDNCLVTSCLDAILIFLLLTGTCLFLVLFVLAIVFAVIMGLLIISWWIGELTVFANNERMTGNGCFPRPNL